MNIQKNIETIMTAEIKAIGNEIRIDEFDRNGNLSASKVYSRLIYAVRKMINFAQGEFPVYQNSSVTSMGYKMQISIN